jgi:hypothetical protein
MKNDELLTHNLKEEAAKRWEINIANVPDDYNFVLRTYNDGFPKGS